MSRQRRPLALIALALSAFVAVSACGTTGSASPSPDPVREVTAAAAVEMLGERTVIDVRTPAEYAAGHVAGALNVDVEAATFDQQVAGLDRDTPYLVYCRTGRRGAIAAEKMAAAGFTDIVDAGGLQSLVEAGATLE